MALRAVARSGGFGLLALLVERGTGLLVMVLLARHLGSEDFGAYSYAVVYLTIFQVLADFGLEPTLLRRLCQEPADRPDLLGSALALRVGLALGAGALAVALAPLAAADLPGGRPLIAAAAAALLFVGQPMMRACLRAELRLGGVLAAAVTASGLAIALVFLALVARASVATVFAALATANLAGFLLAAALAHPRLRLVPGRILARWGSLLREAWPIGANLLVYTLGLRIGALLLMRLRGPVEVGYFASASRLVEALGVVAEATMLTAFPMLARFAAGAHADFEALARLLARYLGAALIAVALLLGQIAPELLERLFRPEFAAAAPAFAILAWSAPLAALGILYSNVLVAVGRQAVLFRVNAVAVVVQAGLQAWLIASFGLTGAALALVLASIAGHTALYLLPGTSAWIRPCVHAVFGAAAVAGAVAVGLRLLPDAVPAVIRGGVALLGYAVGLAATGQVSRADLHALRVLAQRRAEAEAASPA